MADKSTKDVEVSENSTMPAAEEKLKEVSKRKKKGLLSRIWHGLFGSRRDDFERRLERISKEEAAVLSRIRRRALSGARMKRHLILFSVILEFVAVGYAIMTARSVEDWKKRAFRVLPMFVLPAVSSVTYSATVSITNMCERKDQKILEKLRDERQAKIDELKERTNYYITQQLIQRYDTDPAAKAAAASVLASKLGADSGLKVHLRDDRHLNAAAGKSNDVELVQSTGLRNRKQPPSRSSSPGSTISHRSGEITPEHMEAEIVEHAQPVYVDHYQGEGSNIYSGGWLARIAALLVGEDPTQCYALICGNCHRHNGLASKEDFPFLNYICPHCHAVNGPRQKDGRGLCSIAPNLSSLGTEDNLSASTCPSDMTPDGCSHAEANPVVTPGSQERVSEDHAS